MHNRNNTVNMIMLLPTA